MDRWVWIARTRRIVCRSCAVPGVLYTGCLWRISSDKRYICICRPVRWLCWTVYPKMYALKIIGKCDLFYAKTSFWLSKEFHLPVAVFSLWSTAILMNHQNSPIFPGFVERKIEILFSAIKLLKNTRQRFKPKMFIYRSLYQPVSVSNHKYSR